MRIQVAVPEEHVSPEVIDASLEAVTRLDEHMIRSGQAPTSRQLIKAGAIWRPEPPGDEHFDHVGTIAARGWGDCDDWAPAHAATLRASGEDPGAVARVVPSGPSTYHAIVQRSDGSIEDPSIAAGMKAKRVGELDPDRIQVFACDPHDGRVYQGSLLPTVAPLALNCGPTFAVRGATVVGAGSLFEGRCDVPIAGSPLLHVRSYWRHKPHLRRRCHGAIPYAISCSALGVTPRQALNAAIVGAILCGDAAELHTSLDRYKLLATQHALAGYSPGQVREALVHQMTGDLLAHAKATGTHPEQHSKALLSQLARQGHVSGCIVGGFFDDIGKIASGVVSTISDVGNTIAKAVTSVPWGDIIHDVQAAVSVVPGLGTAVSDVIAAAESAYDAAAAALSGNPLEGAIHAAYNFALASVPGAAALHPVLDPVLNTLLAIAVKKEPVDSAVLDGLLSALPDSPRFGPISPRSVAASLGHMIISHLGVKNTSGRPAVNVGPTENALMRAPMGVQAAVARARAAMAAAHPAAAHAPPAIHVPLHAVHHTGPKRRGVPHAAVHVQHAAAHVPPVVHRPGSPGAPPGATHWQCHPGPGGTWACRWV